MKAVVLRRSFAPDRRILAVSDVHGNLPWLRGLLEKAAFAPEDVLVLVGDLLERGRESLAALRYVMDLSKTHTVFCLSGNCDRITLAFDSPREEDRAWMPAYLRRYPNGLLCQMAAEAGLDPLDGKELAALAALLPVRFAQELAFLRAMPTILESERFVFVHGGVPSYQNMEGLNAWSCMKNDNFLGQGYSFPKYCVVGHWPTSSYCPGIPCCDPIVDRDRKIVSIDGGCSLNRGGQLNALILPTAGQADFSWVRYDDYPVKTARETQTGSDNPVTIRWVDNAVEILERGEEFAFCRQLATGRTLYVPSGYLWREGGTDRCEDCTDYRLPVKPGDDLSILAETTQGAMVKKDGVIGWYLGQLSD